MHIYLHLYIHENMYTCIPHKDTKRGKVIGAILRTKNPFRVSCLLGIRSEKDNRGCAIMADSGVSFTQSVKVSLMYILLGLG